MNAAMIKRSITSGGTGYDTVTVPSAMQIKER